MEDFDFAKIVKEEWDKVVQKDGRTNILIAGKTGVGKSTLINSIFQGEMAQTGNGKPVTQEIKEITKEGIPVSIFDTKGLEVKDYKSIIAELEKFVSDRKNETDVNRQIHVAWLCITEDSRRVEDAEIELAESLSKYIPVIGVITKARADNGFESEVRKLLPAANNVIRVRAIEETLDEGFKLPQMNLDKLVDLTSEVLPEGRRNAFIAAQKASLKQKQAQAQKVIVAAAAAAVAAGVTPIPFSDAAILVPTEIGMLAGISKIFGLNLSKGLLGTLVSSMFGATGATIAGKTIVSTILKFIPGVGSVAGAAISGATAGTLTTSLGELYVATLTGLFSLNKDEPPSVDEIEKAFKEKLLHRTNSEAGK